MTYSELILLNPYLRNPIDSEASQEKKRSKRSLLPLAIFYRVMSGNGIGIGNGNGKGHEISLVAG
ncbi:hypothetical protein GIB67_029826 [Kingdonia uniflora]|uniref:Uncharacterized protein n=1 Tax=Kingdonia uniflora TaxID=39325 RepID=A0A7J7NJW4_9MAGN|nr:hypothetical protein GIB67_029826 [Kingdonia uniflora]